MTYVYILQSIGFSPIWACRYGWSNSYTIKVTTLVTCAKKNYDVFQICQKDDRMLFAGLTNDEWLRQSRYAAAIRNICKAASAEPRAPAMSRSGTIANWTI